MLQNNAQDNLTVAANGPFTFGLSIPYGTGYTVTVRTQPVGQVCTVSGGVGTATANVTTVAVSCKSNVSVGGTISGLAGTVVLQNNGGNPLATATNGPFTFTSLVPNGSPYSVTVRTQPTGQTCSVANGTGTATANVTNVAVTCETFTLRPLPAIYTTGKSVNYSAFRAGGPAAGEIPSDADILQDLGLLRTAGFNLLRLFGADDVSDKILRLAAANFPEMRFQQGINLVGIPVASAASCQDPAGENDRQINRAIALANKYPSIVAVAVGNENSFFSKFMPIPCVEKFITRVRSSVTQPVTTEDDWTFFAGLTTAGGDRDAVKPDTILPLIDFVAIHTYPILNDSRWNWQQTAVPAGQARAAAMMNASLVYAKDTYAAVAAYLYKDAAGNTVSTGASLPITVGETGWKAVQTNPASAIETYAALPVNQKWYYDLMNSWRGTSGGPVTIFFFVAFDEAWKGIDDGWGLWDRARAPRYALCGTPAGSPCNADVYAGAGYFGAPPGGGGGGSSAFSTITFDSPTVTYTLTGFGGAEDSSVVHDPTGGANKVAKVVKSATAELWAGTTVSTGANQSVGKIPFDAANTRMTVRVYSPNAGYKVRLKVEDAADPTRSAETEATTTVANAWETLTFDFANPAPGTAPLNFSYTYNKTSIFFNFGVPGSTTGAKTYYFDDVAFIGGTGGGGGGSSFSPITFDSATVTYTLTGFGGAEDSSVVHDPTGGANKVAKVVKSATAEVWAGTTVSTGPNQSVGKIPFDAANTRMTVRVYSPNAGYKVRLKVEDAADGTRSAETEATTTVANAWETLTFDFANPAAGTAALNFSYTYNKISIFFNFGTTAPRRARRPTTSTT